MAKKTFGTLWGDWELEEDKIKPIESEEKDPPEDPPKKKPEEEEEEEGVKSTPPVTKKEGGEEKEEYEFTEDDVSKAYTILEEEGVLNISDDDEFEATAKGLGDAIAVSIDKKVTAKINSLPDEVKALYFHMKDGGDANSFAYTESVDWEEFSAESDADKEKSVREHLISQGLDTDEVESELADIIEAGKLDTKSSIAIKVLSKNAKIAKKARADKLEADRMSDAKDAQADIDAIKTKIDSMSEYEGFELNDARKKEFKDYLFKQDKRTGKTQMQMNMSDEDRKLKIAFLDFINYTKADLEAGVKDKLTKDRKKKLVKYSSSNIKNKNSSVSVKEDKGNKGKLVIPAIFGAQNIEVED